MIGFMTDETQFNKFINIDSIDTRIVNYLRDSESKEAERIWKLLKYSDMRALFQEPLTKKEKNELIYRDKDQNSKRIFTMPLVEDSMTETCSLLKIYISSIEPTDHLRATVNIAIDILSHNKLNNVYNDSNDELENPLAFRPVEQEIMLKSRQEVFLKNILAELNGADIEGVGVLVFDKNLSPFSQAKLGYFNNKNYTGYQLLMACMQSGVA